MQIISDSCASVPRQDVFGINLIKFTPDACKMQDNGAVLALVKKMFPDIFSPLSL